MIPRVGGVATEACWPQQNLVFVLHAVLVVVVVQVVTHAVVVVVESVDHRVWLSAAGGNFHRILNPVAVPVVIRPVGNAVVVMVERGLFLAPETTGDGFLNVIRDAVVVVIGVFAVRDAVVVVVHVVVGRLPQALAQDTKIPHRLEVTVAISIEVVAVVIVVHTVCTAEEVRIQLAVVVVKVVVAVHFKEVPDAVVVVVHVIPVVDRIVIVIDVDGVVREVAVGVAINIIVVEIRTKFVGEVRFRTVVGLPLPETDQQSKPGDVGVAVVDNIRVGNAGFRSAVATEVEEVAAALCPGRAADFRVGRRDDRALVDVRVGTCGIRRTKLRIYAV